MFFVPPVALLNVFPTVAEKSHICHRTVADQWLKTNWAQESSSRKEMLIWFMPVSQNILIRYFDWFGHKKMFIFHPDLPLAMSLLMIPREFKQLLHCQFLWLKARIGNWDLKANFIPLVWSKLSNTSRRHAQCTLYTSKHRDGFIGSVSQPNMNLFHNKYEFGSQQIWYKHWTNKKAICSLSLSLEREMPFSFTSRWEDSVNDQENG